MKIRYLAAGGALALAAVTVTVAPGVAGADAAQPSAAFAGRLITGGGGPTIVKITYTCSSTESPANHLYLAVKQGPKVNPTNHSSSSYAKTYYSTNWSVDSGPNKLNCDGVQHTQRIVLKPDAAFVQKVPRLHKGLALVQICVFDNVTGMDANGEPIGGVALNYTMERVHVRTR